MSAPISAYVGPNGNGKTLAAVQLHALPALARGEQVWANFQIHGGNLLTSWRDLLDIHDCTLILDEISSALPARQSMSAPAGLIRTLEQLRKINVETVWTAPAWARADTVLRAVTQEVTDCRGIIFDRYQRREEIPPAWRPYPPALRDANGKRIHSHPKWRPRSLFRLRTYDANAFEDFTNHVIETLKPLRKEWLWRPWHEGQYAYDTLESVQLLDHLTDTGVCIHCGGTRRRPKCTCGDYNSRRGPAASTTPPDHDTSHNNPEGATCTDD